MDLQVFTQAFVARIVPSEHEVLLAAIRNFQFEQYPQHAALAGLGALLGSLLLYYIGVWLRRWPERVSTDEQREKIENVRGKAQEILPWLLVFSPLPVGGLLVIAAAFFRVPGKKVAAIVVLTEIVFRSMPYIS